MRSQKLEISFSLVDLEVKVRRSLVSSDFLRVKGASGSSRDCFPLELLIFKAFAITSNHHDNTCTLEQADTHTQTWTDRQTHTQRHKYTNTQTYTHTPVEDVFRFS